MACPHAWTDTSSLTEWVGSHSQLLSHHCKSPICRLWTYDRHNDHNLCSRPCDWQIPAMYICLAHLAGPHLWNYLQQDFWECVNYYSKFGGRKEGENWWHEENEGISAEAYIIKMMRQMSVFLWHADVMELQAWSDRLGFECWAWL